MTDDERHMKTICRDSSVIAGLAWTIADMTVSPSDRVAETQRIITDAYAKYDEEVSGDE